MVIFYCVAKFSKFNSIQHDLTKFSLTGMVSCSLDPI